MSSHVVNHRKLIENSESLMHHMLSYPTWKNEFDQHEQSDTYQRSSCLILSQGHLNIVSMGEDI